MSGERIEAHFWVAPGVEIAPGRFVPNPPPLRYRFATYDKDDKAGRIPPNLEDLPPDGPQIIDVDFVLSAWKKGSEVAHYDRVTEPPDGFRFIAADGRLWAERAE